MEQFSKSTSGELSDETRGILSYLTSLFLKRKESQEAPLVDQTSLGEVSLPSVAPVEAPKLVFARYSSAAGDPTLLSVRRATELPPGIVEQVEFHAIQNYDPFRQILSYKLETLLSGEKVLHGYLREIGLKPRVSGPCAPDESPRLLSFELKTDGSAGTNALLARDAHKLVEIFADRGIEGVDEYLHRVKATLGHSNAFVERGTSLERLLDEEHQPSVWSDISAAPRRSLGLFTEAQRTNIGYVQRMLTPLNELSQQIFESLRGRYSFLETSEAVEDDDAGSMIDSKALEMIEVSFRLPALRLWAHFTSPDCEFAQSALFSLRMPPVLLGSTKDMSCLTLEIAGPKNRLGIRERYRFSDAKDTLAISEYSFNHELFHNVFSLVHQINAEPTPSQRSIAPLLQLLESYGLHARPANLLSTFANLRRKTQVLIPKGSTTR